MAFLAPSATPVLEYAPQFPSVAPLASSQWGLCQGLGIHSPWLQAGDGPQGEWDLSWGCCLQEVTVVSAPQAPLVGEGRGGRKGGGTAWPQVCLQI